MERRARRLHVRAGARTSSGRRSSIDETLGLQQDGRRVARVRGRQRQPLPCSDPTRDRPGVRVRRERRVDSRSACPTSPRRAPSWRRRASSSTGETIDTGVCHMAFFHDPDGNGLMLHRRYAPLSRAGAAGALPRRCRCRDTRGGVAVHRPEGLRPGRVSANGATSVSSAATMLDLDVAGLAACREGGIEIERVPEGVTFEPLGEHERLGTLVGADDKFTAHNAASLAARAARPRPARRRARPAAVRADRQLGAGRLAVLAAARRRRGGLAVLADRGVRVRVAGPRRLLERGGRAVRRAGREARVRLAAEPLPETWHFATHHARVERDAELDWVAGGFGSKKGKIRIQNDLAGPGATSRVTGCYFADGTQHLDYDTFQEHMAPNTTSDFAFKGALRDTASTVWRGMIRVERDAQKTNAYQENRNLLLSTRPTRTRSRAWRSSPTTCAAPTARRWAGSTASSSST